ncbi:MAG: tyrosine-type recombinase/integrase, partial [Rhodospirillales bacterium]
MPTLKARITATLVDDMQPGDVCFDAGNGATPGFGVRRQTNARSFFLQYRAGPGAKARLRWLTIGRYGAPWTVEQARREARRLRAAIENPLAPVDPQGEAERRKGNGTIAELAADFMAAHQIGDATDRARTKRWSASTIKSTAEVFAKHILPAFGRARPDDVHLRDVAAWHDGIGRNGSPGAANRALAIVGSMFSWAIKRGRRTGSNPCRDVARFPGRKLERHLSTEELQRLGAVLAQIENAEPFRVAAIRLLLLTGARRGEIMGLRWEWVDIERGMLRLPTSKTGAKTIFLSASARQLLANLPRVADNPFVIPGRFPGCAMQNINTAWMRVRAKAGLDDVRLHDLRHTFASTGAASGLGLPVVGALL